MLGKIISIIFGALIAFAFFYILSLLVSDSNEAYTKSTKSTSFDFIRNKTESELEPKERIRPPKPEKKPLPSTPKINIAQQTSKPSLMAVKIDTPKINFSHDIKGDMLTNANIGANMDVIPLVRIPPIYPQKALRMRKEGFVKMRFTVDTDGTVLDIEIIESEPARFFDDAAMRALKRWKFKPKMQDGKAVTQVGEQTITFSLGDTQ